MKYFRLMLIICTFHLAAEAYSRDEHSVSEQRLETEFAVVELHGRLYPYRIFFPSSYRAGPAGGGRRITKFPLVIACHPGGGDEHSYFEWEGNSDRIQVVAEERGYVVAAPAGPEGNWHEKGGVAGLPYTFKRRTPEIVMEVVREIVKQRRIDENRIYLMGASSGGVATYATAASHPTRFAAVAGVVAYFEPQMVPSLSKVPVLMFNAQKDRLITIERIRTMKESLEEAGGEVQLVEVPGGHGGYRNYAAYKIIFDWFDLHRREGNEN